MIFDEFYQDLYHDFFYQWILLNTSSYLKDQITCQLKETTQQLSIIEFDALKVKGLITIWYNNIVEEEVYHKETNELLFYLHYIIMDLGQCKNLFHQFYHTIINFNQKKQSKIALCCTGGLSTAVFVDQMQEVCRLENVQFQLESLSLDQLYQDYHYYDALYLAPQIAYMEPELLSLTHHEVPLYRIDATSFATKDYLSIVTKIQNNLDAQNATLK